MEIEVPWSWIPISEPVLPGEESLDEREAKGFPVYTPALVSTVASISTSEARRRIERGEVRIDGAVVGPTFVYIKPGALVECGQGAVYRLGRPEDAAMNRTSEGRG